MRVIPPTGCIRVLPKARKAKGGGREACIRTSRWRAGSSQESGQTLWSIGKRAANQRYRSQEQVKLDCPPLTFTVVAPLLTV